MKNTAGEKVRKLLDRLIDFRDTQVKRLNDHPELTIGDVTTVNITMIHGGVQSNVVPPEYKVTSDMRIPLDVDHVEFDKTLRKWCDEISDGITIEFEQKQPKVPPTKTDKTNPYWVSFENAINKL